MPLHPFIEAMLAKLSDRPALSAGTPAEARAMVAAMRPLLGEGPVLPEMRDLAIPTRGGTIPARLLVPGPEPLGLVVYLHGGGWVLGEAADYETLGRTLAAESGCAVLLPDYRLAPEHPFPAGLEDAEDALLWAAGQYGARLPLAVAGDSAGANLATVAARRLGTRAPLVLQALVYPVTDCDLDRPSYRAHGTGLPLTTQDMAWFFDHYAPAALRTSPEVSPLRAMDLAGLPPALLLVAEYDVLADEALAYAEALRRAGVPVALRRVERVTHGFLRLHPLFDVAATELRALAAALAAACRGRPA